MFTQGVSLMENELNFKNITCDACGSTCKNIELDIFEYSKFENVSQNSRRFCFDCSKKINEFINQMTNPNEFNI
jgi:hypothetical protein